MPTTSVVPAISPRAKMRCGSIVSPAENVPYCHPSYAQSTPIIAVTAFMTVVGETRAGHHSPGWLAPPPDAVRIAAMSTMTPTFNAVVTACTLALCRVPRTLIAVTAAITTTELPADVAGDSATNAATYRGNAAASVASDPLPMTRNIVQPYRNAGSGPNASFKYAYSPPESGFAAPSSANVSAPSSDSTPPTIHAASAMPPEPASRTTPPGVRKIPDPMTVPTVMKIRSRSERVRRSSTDIVRFYARRISSS